MTVPLRCPVRGCGHALHHAGTSLACAIGHAFDLARSGYVNLLQPQDRKSKTPGDTAAAVAARRRIVERGIEGNIVGEIAAFAAQVTPATAGFLLDAGCGEGSVTMALTVATGREAVGVDIATAAVDRAARRYPGAAWIVANADREMPFPDGTFAMVASVVARRNPAEFARVLVPDGVCLVVVPGEDDLAELREALLGAAAGRDRGTAVEAEFAVGYQLIGRRTIRDRVRLDREALDDVLASTYRGARAAQRDRAAALTSMEVTLCREALAFRRRSG